MNDVESYETFDACPSHKLKPQTYVRDFGLGGKGDLSDLAKGLFGQQ